MKVVGHSEGGACWLMDVRTFYDVFFENQNPLTRRVDEERVENNLFSDVLEEKKL